MAIIDSAEMHRNDKKPLLELKPEVSHGFCHAKKKTRQPLAKAKGFLFQHKEISGMPKIQEFSSNEMERMKEVFSNLKIISKDQKAREFHDFAHNYFKDGMYFFKEGKYTEAFEAFIISWAYIDIGLKLDFFEIPEKVKKFFTIEHYSERHK